MLLWAFQSCFIVIIFYLRFFQGLEDEALAKVKVFGRYRERQKTELCRKLLFFSEEADAELRHKAPHLFL